MKNLYKRIERLETRIPINDHDNDRRSISSLSDDELKEEIRRIDAGEKPLFELKEIPNLSHLSDAQLNEELRRYEKY